MTNIMLFRMLIIQATVCVFQGRGVDSFFATTSFARIKNFLPHRLYARGESGSLLSLPEIPVLDPLPNSPPLVIGASHWMDPPTPLQWRTLETSMDICFDDVAKSTANMASIDAAPVVAVLPKKTVDLDERQSGGDVIATIAAVVGMVAGTNEIDTSDSISFQESMAGLGARYNYDASKVRLLGIGRAKLSNFGYLPVDSSNVKSPGNSGYIESTMTSGTPIKRDTGTTTVLCKESTEDEEEYEIDDNLTTQDVEPVLVARMELILDDETSRFEGSGGEFEFGTKSSPVHALSLMSMWSSRIGFLHQDRQIMVAQLQAAQTRLDMASDSWEDWDGFGDLFFSDNDEDAETNHTVMEGLTDPPVSTTHTPTLQVASTPRVLSPAANRLLMLDNYGLGTSTSTMSGLQQLTTILMELLEPYYSSDRLHSEPFEYSLFSWVTLASLQDFLGHGEIQKIMALRNTVERMSVLYSKMLAHKLALKELGQSKARELEDCGEACDDIF